MSADGSSITQAVGSLTYIKKGSALVAARASERVVAQQAFSADPKYKKYTQQVDKCLSSFDNVHEWADFIAFLKQLLKTFQSYTQFKEVPRKLVVAKRLSQCLNPALPSGVHQRALDVYSHILSVLGSDGLRRDLALWSFGLFPFFEYASTSVKPILLGLYETHYLPLQEHLRPIMKSFILALLPGLEEETGEFFERVLSLLDRLSGTVSPAFFFQNIWLVILTTPSARGTSLNFLSRRLPRLNADEDVTPIIGQDVGLMIRSFAAALEDDNLLVRRGTLDILLQSVRIDSAAVKVAQPDDRTILMRAASGVVLRRDLALNRRLYTWLLGPEEKNERQIAYFRQHSLELLRKTLRDEMFSPSGDYLESRPFKVFISLLDKWEIGAALTDILVYDAFVAVQKLLESVSEGKEDLLMTASTLYEAVEPQVFWRQMLTSLIDEVTGQSTQLQAIVLTSYILRTFTVEDDEVQTVHLPIVFSALVDVLRLHALEDPSRVSTVVMLQSLSLLDEILHHIRPGALLKYPELDSSAPGSVSENGPYAFARAVYGLRARKEESLQSSASTPFASVFESLVELTVTCVQHQEVAKDISVWRQVFGKLLLLLGELVSTAPKSDDPTLISWNPDEWLHAMLGCLKEETVTFSIIDRMISLAISLHTHDGLKPHLTVNKRQLLFTMITKLLSYLRPEYAIYHVRAVHLIWSLENVTTHSYVESIIAQSLTSPETRHLQETYDAFGILWRLTDDDSLPGFRLKVPMMIVLDSLKNDDPSLRRVGETWMRCNLKSYLRVLDPILYDIFDPTIRRKPVVANVNGRELQGFLYERPFDQRYIHHVLETLLSVVRFGGQGFSKTTRITAIRRSHHVGFLGRLQTSVPNKDATYLDALIDVLLRFLQSEPHGPWAPSMQPHNILLQSSCVDILQVIVSRGEMDNVLVETVEAAVIGKLYFCIHNGRLDLQNKLLHLLHSLISVSTSAVDFQSNRNTSRHVQLDSSEDVRQDRVQPSRVKTYSVNPLLVQTLIDGVATRSNRPVLQHWLDFILMALPQFQPTLSSVLPPLNDCFCRQLRWALVGVLQVSAQDDRGENDLPLSVSDAEFVMLLHALERLVLLGLADASEPIELDDEGASVEKGGPENSGLLGYVSNVFTSDNVPNIPEDQLSSRSPGYRSLHEGIRISYMIWATLVWSPRTPASSKDDSLSLIFNRSRTRSRRVLEHLFHARPAEVLESIVDCWSREILDPRASPDSALELIDVLIANAQSAVHMLCEAISYRTTPSSERVRKQALNANLSDITLFRFLECYLQRLEGPLALQVWGRYLQLVKDMNSGTKDFKGQMFYAMRCLYVLSDKVTQTTAMEDRRLRRELQENYVKLLDSCVAFVGRSSEQGSWMKRTKEAAAANGRESPAPRSDVKSDEKNGSTLSLPDVLPSSAGGGSVELLIQIIEFVASSVVPQLRRFLMDNDKVASACGNIVYYIINPALRSKQRPLEADDTTVQILIEMSKIPAALKAWRTPVVDLLNDNRLFSASAAAAVRWKPVVRALFEVDKTALPELLSRIATVPSANIFTNREYEMLLRATNLRRLALVLLAGEKNQFLAHLPAIQEKLVDVFRSAGAPGVQSEAYLCFRVLLCRLSAHNLTSFWPVVLTELYRLFEQLMITPPSDGSEDLQLYLAASKVLDLLLVLQTEEFQIHQWIFVTDTVDAVYPPEAWTPEALLDQLAEVIAALPAPAPPSTSAGAAPPGVRAPPRAPLLGAVRAADSARDLLPFFARAGGAGFEGAYRSGGAGAGAGVDWEAVERGVMEDLFEGR